MIVECKHCRTRNDNLIIDCDGYICHECFEEDDWKCPSCCMPLKRGVYEQYHNGIQCQYATILLGKLKAANIHE